MTMHAEGTAFLVLAAAATGICAALAGCGSGPGAPAGSALAATRQADGQRQGQVTGSSRTPAARTAARSGTPSVRTPSAAPARHAPAASPNASAALTSGLYTDAPDGTPHYVLSFTSTAGSALRGSASFLYQDGRVSTVGSYAGTLTRSGKITLTLANGKALTGTYAGGRLNLAGCAAALPLAKAAGGCTFTYHGHVP
jgi:hypothetical protein